MLQQAFPVGQQTPTPNAGHECRVYKRLDCELPTSCAPAASGELRWSATIRDISVSGLRLSLRRRFERGAGLAIEMPGAPGQEPYLVFVKVMNTRAEDGGTWSLGCKFISELSEDELQRLLDATNAPAAPPGGESPAPANRREILNALVRLEVEPGRYVRGRVKKLRVPDAWPLAPGATLEFRGQAANGSQWHHDIEVLRCDPAGDSWRLDARVIWL